jgi:molecular chaperone HtpG
MTTATTAQTYSFQAETQQLLDLMIHALYSNKDVFLRELISNAADAIDKRRFEAITQPHLLDSDSEPYIRLTTDKEARTLTLDDNGIGMSEAELIDLLGTIAQSGTKAYGASWSAPKGDTPDDTEERETQKVAKDPKAAPDLIGQFGVGFYASFMVAHEVSVISRKAGTEQAFLWRSKGKGHFEIEPASLDHVGTRIILSLKPVDKDNGIKDYTDTWELRGLVKQASDFVAHPIQVLSPAVTDAEKPEDNKEATWETVNSQKALWTRPESEVIEEDYAEFYKQLSHDWAAPLKTIRTHFEGGLEADSLLFVPAKSTWDLYQREAVPGLQLFVKRVLIQKNCQELLPAYLRFIRGVVDAEDLSLNVSRELLQQDRQIQTLKKRLVKKVLSVLQGMKDHEAEAYQGFWNEFGKVLKEGLYEDTANKEKLLALLHTESTTTEGKATRSLHEYRMAMKPEQEAIYYLTGENRASMEQAPQLEAFKAKGYEVILLSDAIDPYWVATVTEFDGKPLRSIVEANALPEEQEDTATTEAWQQKETQFSSLLENLKQSLGEKISKVSLSKRLRQSPVCLVQEAGEGLPPGMEQWMRAMNQPVPPIKRRLELNPDHAMIKALLHKQQANGEATLPKEWAEVLYGQALLAEGRPLENPAAFTQELNKLLTSLLPSS